MNSATDSRTRLAAILAADAAGYSRLMAADEQATVAALDAARAVFRGHIDRNQGRVIDMAGDSVLAVFETAGGAVTAALEIQRDLAFAAGLFAEDQRLRFRVGIHLGDVIEKPDGTIYGDGVNIAARLQALAQPGGISVSSMVHEAVRDRVSAMFADQGEHQVKNIARPVHVYRVSSGSASATRAPSSRRQSSAFQRRWHIPAAASLLALCAGAWISFADGAKDARTWLVAQFGGATLPAPLARARIAVMPFVNLSGDAKRDYLSDGMTEDIISALGRFSGLEVISHNAVRAYKSKSASPQELKTALDVRYIVQGSLREAGGRLRTGVELSDADKGVLLWSERYDGEGSELFEIQDRIVKSIVSNLQFRVTQLERERVTARPVESLEAYDLVLRARWLLDKLDRAANREARALLARASELSPDSPDVLTAQGEAEIQRALYGWVEDAAGAAKRAEELARRALTSSDKRAHVRAHALLATIYSNLGADAEALKHAESAIALNPSDAKALSVRGFSLLYSGRVTEGISALEDMRRFDPELGSGGAYSLAVGYYVAGRYRDALATAELLAARFPRDVAPAAVRAAVFGQLGQQDEALRAADIVRRLNPAFEVENFGTRFATPEHTAKLQEGLRKAGL